MRDVSIGENYEGEYNPHPLITFDIFERHSRRYSIKMQRTWNHARPAAGPDGRKPKRNGPHHEQGLEVKDALSPSGRGRKMFLTSPLIDQAFTLKCPSPGR